MGSVWCYLQKNLDVILLSAIGSFVAALLFWAVFHWQFIITFLSICVLVAVALWIRSRRYR